MIEDFIQKIEDEFDDLTPGTLTPESEFRKVIDWNSICALLMISLIDTEYDITITADELRNAQTIHDLFQVIEAKGH